MGASQLLEIQDPTNFIAYCCGTICLSRMKSSYLDKLKLTSPVF